jgi:large subunit ribosomal protein L18
MSKLERKTRIKLGIRKRVHGTTQRPRLTVFRSNRGIYAQLIDDTKGHTIAQASSMELEKKGKLNVEVSKEVGKKMAERAKGAGVEMVVFDRSGYLYHGNVKALAEGAREGGLNF